MAPRGSWGPASSAPSLPREAAPIRHCQVCRSLRRKGLTPGRYGAPRFGTGTSLGRDPPWPPLQLAKRHA
eukprot:4206547-Lingulodinium_polyedra.AAC.1